MNSFGKSRKKCIRKNSNFRNVLSYGLLKGLHPISDDILQSSMSAISNFCQNRCNFVMKISSSCFGLTLKASFNSFIIWQSSHASMKHDYDKNNQIDLKF